MDGGHEGGECIGAILGSVGGTSSPKDGTRGIMYYRADALRTRRCMGDDKYIQEG